MSNPDGLRRGDAGVREYRSGNERGVANTWYVLGGLRARCKVLTCGISFTKQMPHHVRSVAYPIEERCQCLA